MVDWVVACFAIALGPQVTYLSGVPGHRTPFTLLIESGYGLETIFGFAVVGVVVCIPYLLCICLFDWAALASTIAAASVETTRCYLHCLWYFGGFLYGRYLINYCHSNGDSLVRSAVSRLDRFCRLCNGRNFLFRACPRA